MRQTLPTKLDLTQIMSDIRWLPKKRDDSGVEMYFPPSGGMPSILESGNFGSILKAIAEISDLRKQKTLHLMINILPGGVSVPEHTDTLLSTKLQGPAPRVERWHLPIVTNKNVFWWDEQDGEWHMPIGHWYGPMPYWLKHKVANFGHEDRVHLVVDLDTPQRVEL